VGHNRIWPAGDLGRLARRLAATMEEHWRTVPHGRPSVRNCSPVFLHPCGTGRNDGGTLANSSARTDVPPPNGPGLLPDTPTTSAPGPLLRTATKTGRNLSISTDTAVACSAAASQA